MSETIVGAALEAHKRRAHARFAVDWPARIMLADKSLYQVKVVDVSAGGVGIVFDQLLGKGTPVNIEFFAVSKRKKERIRAKSVVCHNTFLNNGDAKLGLQFTGISHDELNLLNNIIQEFVQDLE